MSNKKTNADNETKATTPAAGVTPPAPPASGWEPYIQRDAKGQWAPLWKVGYSRAMERIRHTGRFNQADASKLAKELTYLALVDDTAKRDVNGSPSDMPSPEDFVLDAKLEAFLGLCANASQLRQLLVKQGVLPETEGTKRGSPKELLASLGI